MAGRNQGRDLAGREVSIIFQRYLARMIEEADRAAGVWAEGAGPTARRMILQRTEAGIDRNGRRFARYKPATVRKRRAAGRVVSRVTLRMKTTGSMLDSLAVRSGLVFGSVELYFSERRAERIARFHLSGTKRMAARDFFGLQPSEARILAEAFRNEVRRRVPKDRRRRVTLTLLSV